VDSVKSKPIRQHTGIFAVVLGPDGSGKSTVVDQLLRESESIYTGSWCFHWRPGLLPQPSRQAKQRTSSPLPPPNEFAYGGAISLLRYCYFLLDFVAGYWLRIYPRRRQGQLVIGERWYFDVLINPQRYGFRLPAWLLRLGGRLIPRPDLTILLKADPTAIHARKPELTVEQITNQIAAMRSILPSDPHGAEVATDVPLGDSVASVRASLHATSERLRGIDVWRAFPRLGKPKVFIANSAPVRSALQLYNPYSRAGRFAKRLAEFLPRVLTTRRLTSAAELSAISHLIRATMDDDDLIVSYATGTPGPHRKMTAQVHKDGRVAAYVKVARSFAAIELLKREAAALDNLPMHSDNRIAIPHVLAQADQDGYRLLALSAPETASQTRPLEFDERDIAFVEAMTPQEPEALALDAVWNNLSVGRHADTEIVRASRSALEKLLGSTGVRVAPAHGDYAPWNTLYLADHRLFVFDWEYFNQTAPVLGDIFQRTFMPDWLVRHLPPHDAARKLIALRSDPRLQGLLQRLEIKEQEFTAYVLLYLLRQGLRNADDGGVPAYIQACLRSAITRVDVAAARSAP
jgi:thymidylate kinase